MLKDRDTLVSKHEFAQCANIVHVYLCPHVSPINSLCFLVTYCLGDKAFIFPLCNFFPFFPMSHLFTASSFVMNAAIRRQDTKKWSAVFFVIQTFSLNFKCEYFSKFIFSFPLRTKQLIISCDVEKVWSDSQRYAESLSKQQLYCGHPLQY